MFLPIDIINGKKWFIKLKTTILSFVIFSYVVSDNRISTFILTSFMF